MQIKQPVLPNEMYRVEALRDYVQYGNMRFFAKGSTVFMPGDVLNQLIFIVYGSVQLTIVKEDGQESLFYLAEENHIIGRLFDTMDNYLVANAIKDTMVCLFSKEQLKQIFAINDELYFEILKNCTSKVSYLKNKMAISASASSCQKVYQLFLLLCQNATKTEAVEGQESLDYVLELGISQKTIADVIGVHPVTISKIFNQLVRDGIIEKKDHKIIVHDIKALVELVYDATEL